MQLSARFSDKLDAVTQVIIQDRYDDHISNFVELAFLRYQFNRNWSGRIGRFSANSYLFTDSRYIGHSSDWVRASIDMYLTVGAVGNINGTQLNYLQDVELGAVKVSLSCGENKFYNGRDTEFTLDYSNFAGVTVELQAIDWRVQASYLSATIENAVFEGNRDD